MEPIESYIGIDFGTTSIKIAYFNKQIGTIQNVQFSDGTFLYPCYYANNIKNGKKMFGPAAKNQMPNNAFTVAYEVKRFIGKKYDDETIQEEMKRVSYRTMKNQDNGEIMIVMGPNKVITPIEFYKKILKEIKKHLEVLSIKSKNCVITVPVTFGNNEREMIKNMMKSEELGYEKIQIMNELTAAAIDFGINEKEEGNYVIFDYGRGTLDITVIKIIRGNKNPKIEVITHGGLRNNGGSDFDEIIMNRVIEDIEEGVIYCEDSDGLVTYLKSKKGSSKFKVECESCKIALSQENEYSFSLPNPDNEEILVTITRKNFEEEICKAKFEEAVQCLVDTINQSGVDVKSIIMVGGSSQIPCLQPMIEEATGIKPELSEHPLLAVSRGAALEGASLANQAEIEKIEVATYSVEIETTIQHLPAVQTVIPKDSKLPFKGEFTFKIDHDGQDKIVTYVFQNAKVPDPSKRLGKIEIWFDDYTPKENDRVILNVVHTAEGLLELNFTLPDSPVRQTYQHSVELARD